MKPFRNWLVPFGAVALLIAALIFTARESHRATAAQAALTTARLDQAKARFAVVKATPGSAVVEPVRTIATSSAAEPMSDAFLARLEELKRNAPSKGPGGVPLIVPEDLFDYSPALRAAYVEAARGKVRIDYGLFFANAHLSPAQIEAFYAIKEQREQEWLASRKLPAAEAEAKNRESIKAHDARMAALLGPEGSRQLLDYKEQSDTRNPFIGLRWLVSMTYASDEPISVGQMNQLTAVATEWGMYSVTKVSERADALDQLAVKAASILSPKQFELFELLLDGQRVSIARSQAMNAAAKKPEK